MAQGRRQPEGVDPVSGALREVLSLAALTRVEIAERLGLALRDVEAVEHVMTARDEGLGPVELSRRLGVTSAAATQGVHRLERAGHVVRRPHPVDRRRQVVEVTPGGAQHVMSELGPLLARLSQVAAALDEDQQAVVQAYLGEVAEVMRDYVAGREAPVSTPD